MTGKPGPACWASEGDSHVNEDMRQCAQWCESTQRSVESTTAELSDFQERPAPPHPAPPREMGKRENSPWRRVYREEGAREGEPQ